MRSLPLVPMIEGVALALCGVLVFWLSARDLPPSAAGTAPPETAAYVASTEAVWFHRRDCRLARGIRPDRLIGFDSRAAAGRIRVPCTVCRPDGE